MPRCELSGKSPVVKCLVSHSHIRTKSRALPNVQKKSLYSRVLNQTVVLKVATSVIRDIEHQGGFDTYLIRASNEVLSKRALAAKKRILSKISGVKKNDLNDSNNAKEQKAEEHVV